MSYLCITPISANTATFTQVSSPSLCSSYISEPSLNFSAGLTYTDANQLITATALLFSVVFVLRLILKKIGF